MKKLSLLLLLPILCTCGSSDDKQSVYTTNVAPSCTISKMEFEGHRYIVFQFGGSGDAAVVHDPECPLCKSRAR